MAGTLFFSPTEGVFWKSSPFAGFLESPPLVGCMELSLTAGSLELSPKARSSLVLYQCPLDHPCGVLYQVPPPTTPAVCCIKAITCLW